MAQLVARLVRIEKVRGSNPLSSTMFRQLRATDQDILGLASLKESGSGDVMKRQAVHATPSARRRCSVGGVVRLSLGVGFAAGFAVAAVLWRRQVRALVRRAKPYDRKPSRVNNPALIINSWSGDGKAEKFALADEARKANVRPIMLERGDDLVRLAHDAVSAGADAIGMAGGDGSLGLVAGVAVERDVPFFCVPIGTRNHFALDLGLDRDNPLTALDALRDGDEILIDFGVANGRPFLNNVSFGFYAQAVHREEYRAEKAAILADAITRAASDVNEQAALRYVTPDGRTHERAPLLLVSNNVYKFSGHPDYGRRLRLDSGKLGIGALTNLPEGDITKMSLDQLLGLQQWEATSFGIESEEEILAGLDGEALEFESPLTISMHPKGLRVLVPAGTRPGYVPTGEVVAAKLLDVAETLGFGDQ